MTQKSRCDRKSSHDALQMFFTQCAKHKNRESPTECVLKGGKRVSVKLIDDFSCLVVELSEGVWCSFNAVLDGKLGFVRRRLFLDEGKEVRTLQTDSV